jgi:hypothetical protein
MGTIRLIFMRGYREECCRVDPETAMEELRRRRYRLLTRFHHHAAFLAISFFDIPPR